YLTRLTSSSTPPPPRPALFPYTTLFRSRRTSYDVSRPLARPWLYGIATTLIARYHRDEGRHYRALERTGIDPLPEPMAEGVVTRSEEHTSELQSRVDLVCRLLLEKKKQT